MDNTQNARVVASPAMTLSMIEYGKRARLSSLALCTATDPEASFKSRLEAFRTALAQWEVGSVDYKNVLRQAPNLFLFLNVELP